MKVAVTGGAGFIGSNLTSTLLTAGYEVSIFDNLETGSFENLKDFKVDFVKGDLRNRSDVENFLSKETFDY